MKVAVIESAAQGGLLHYAAQLADALADRGHDVDLLTARENELLGRRRFAHMPAVLPAPTARRAEPPRGLRYVVRRGGIALRLMRASARSMWELRRGSTTLFCSSTILTRCSRQARRSCSRWSPGRPLWSPFAPSPVLGTDGAATICTSLRAGCLRCSGERTRAWTSCSSKESAPEPSSPKPGEAPFRLPCFHVV